jgi:hypothetical protein
MILLCICLLFIEFIILLISLFNFIITLISFSPYNVAYITIS